MKKTFRPSELGTITGVANTLGRTRSAVRAAIKRGAVDTVELGCGANVVVIASAKKWDASDSTPGRKKTS